MRKTVFIKNAAILTASSLILRFAGIIFKVWLAAKIGAEGIGLYQLVFSLYVFVSTFATSGISTAVTRLVSEELVVGNKSGVKQIVLRCTELSIAIAIISIAALFFGGDIIATQILKDARAALSIKILGFSLPFMAVSSCAKGYFLACRKASPASSAQLIEQSVRIGTIMLLLLRFDNMGLEYSCAAVLMGDTIAEGVACFYVYLRYKFDFKKLTISTPVTRKNLKITRAVTHIALPITAGRYLNSALRMIENILVPICLSATSSNNGISLFGMIKGMALPLLFFPSTLLSALSTLLIPEMSDAAVRGRFGVVRSIAYKIIKITSLIGLLFSALFLVIGNQLGMLIYSDRDVGFLLCALSPVVPFMYLDAVADGILKGLDQQKFTFYTSVSDSAVRILLILLCVSKWGIWGFIGIMYLSNFATCILNARRLIKISGLKIEFTSMFLLPFCCAFTLALGISTAVRIFFTMPAIVYIILVCTVCSALYILCLYMLGIVDRDDMRFLTRK